VGWRIPVKIKKGRFLKKAAQKRFLVWARDVEKARAQFHKVFAPFCSQKVEPSFLMRRPIASESISANRIATACAIYPKDMSLTQAAYCLLRLVNDGSRRSFLWQTLT
jgi:hypothetical protein